MSRNEVNNEGKERREKLIEILNMRTEPIPGKSWPPLGVSRQVMFRISHSLEPPTLIFSPTKGYFLYQADSPKPRRCFRVRHTTDQIEDELCTFVDHGGRILDVLVCHQIYGEITTELIIRNRQDVYDFVKKINEKRVVPLKELTGDIHHHTVEADTQIILNRIEKALREKNYLYE